MQYQTRNGFKTQHTQLLANQLSGLKYYPESWNDVETQSHPWKVCSLVFYSLAKQVLYTTCVPCTGLVTVDGWCSIMSAASGSTANIEGVTLATKLFQVMDLKFRKRCLMSFVDQSHNSATGS